MSSGAHSYDFSLIGRKFTGQSGILELMDDLGRAMTIDPHMRMLGGRQSGCRAGNAGADTGPDSKSPGISTPGVSTGPQLIAEAIQAEAGRPSLCEPHRQRIEPKVETRLSAQRIYQDLVDEVGFSGSYQSVKRFVKQLRTDQPERVWRIEVAPGEEVQIDFGSGAWVMDAQGRRRRPWVLRVVLSFSRKAYSEAVFHQITENLIRLRRHRREKPARHADLRGHHGPPDEDQPFGADLRARLRHCCRGRGGGAQGLRHRAEEDDRQDESYAIIGACFEVYKEKGNGFVEPVYQECLELELAAQKIPFTVQGALRLTYKGTELKQRYIPDFLCYDTIILEIKAVKQLTDAHRVDHECTQHV